jgi:hypothetical protein
MIPQQVIILVFLPVKLVNYFLSKSILLFFRIIENFLHYLRRCIDPKKFKTLNECDKNDCEINIQTRNKCSRCRFKKCITIGSYYFFAIYFIIN